jgi:hypothetical protein
VAFRQAAIPIERQQEFQALRAAVEEVFASPLAGKFLGLLKSRGVPVRRFEQVLAEGLIERAHPGLGSRKPAQALYDALPVSDKSQIREFYLQELEQVASELRRKYSNLYRDL